MADAWGGVGDDDYDDSNPFGAPEDDGYGYGGNGGAGSASGGNGGYGQSEQVQDDRTTDDFLREAIGNLQETEDLGEEGLAHLAAQREVLDNIKGNVNRMDNTLDVADRKITELENPWAIGPVRTAASGKHSKTSGVGESTILGGGGANFNMEGWVLKRARIMKNWNKRYFRQVGGCIEYFYSKDETKLRGQFVLKGAQLKPLSYGEKDSNGAVCNKDNCFEIILPGQRKGDTIHVESTPDYNTWLSCIERQINPERFQKVKSQAAYEAGGIPNAVRGGGGRRGVGFGNEQQDEMLDTIIDKLDNIDGISRMMGHEVEDQTRIISDLTDDMDRLDNRVGVNKERVTRIK